MGLFTDKCINPECDQRVKKGAKFCPKCGSGAPKGKAVCGQCRAEVRTSAKFCPKCGADLKEVARPMVFDDRWARQPEDFAVRLDDKYVRGWLTKPLIVEHGTRAIFLQRGKYKGELREGKHNMGGFLKTLNHFMMDQAITVILLDAGDVTIDLENAGLWTADKFELAASQRIVLRVTDMEAVLLNMLKGAHRIGVGELEDQLAGEIQMVLAGIIAQCNVEDLFQDMEIRERIESALRESLSTTLERLGVELVQLRFIGFQGEAYEQLRAKQGEMSVAEKEADLTAQRAKLNQRLRETMTQEKLDEFKNEQDFQAFVRQSEHEMGLKDVIREDELARLSERFAFERDREALLRRIEVEGIANDEKREQAWKDLIAQERQRDEQQRGELERQLASTKNQAEVKKIELEMERLEHAEDVRQAEEGLALLQKTKDMEYAEAQRAQELEAATLEARSKATAEALLTVLEGPAADRIAKLEELRAQKDMTPDQLLALAAQASPEAAAALAEKYKADGQIGEDRARLLEQQLAQQQQLADGYADRMERLMNTALEQMGQVSGMKARPADNRPTVVAGGGRPVVVGGSGVACPHCGAPVEAGSVFCAACGKKV